MSNCFPTTQFQITGNMRADTPNRVRDWSYLPVRAEIADGRRFPNDQQISESRVSLSTRRAMTNIFHVRSRRSKLRRAVASFTNAYPSHSARIDPSHALAGSQDRRNSAAGHSQAITLHSNSRSAAVPGLRQRRCDCNRLAHGFPRPPRGDRSLPLSWDAMIRYGRLLQAGTVCLPLRTISRDGWGTIERPS
jgi:hypothetical protein